MFRLTCVVVLAIGFIGRVAFGATFGGSYLNQTTILLGTVAAPPGPYPSSITVANLPGLIANVSVILTNVSHAVPDDIDVLLVGPGGQKLVLMSDAGGDNVANSNRLSFSDDFTASLPDSTRILTGTYKPTNYGANDAFPAGAPGAPYDSAFSIFDGTNPNGVWRLYATDDVFGNASGSIGGWHLNIATVAFPPTITSQPTDKVVQPGTDVTFNVSVSGTPPFAYQWLRNGEVIVPFGQGGPTLKVLEVTTNRAGYYSVNIANAANPAGVHSRQARLDVVGPLTVVDPPSTVITQPGADVRLFVGVSGNPPFRYQWTLNGAVLPDETNAFLNLFKVEPESGGDYRAIIWNGDEAVTTDRALVLVRSSTGPAPEDMFAARPTIGGSKGVLQGDSSKATRERGEPIRPGGGKTVWFQWVAPDSGIVTFNSRGSAFDVFLNVFSGVEANNLRRVAGDDDFGGFYTSAFQFNVVRGEKYQIQIDGFGRNGAGGEFTVRWDLEITQEIVPIIVEDPEPQAVVAGDSAFFKVAPDSQDVAYQWYLNGKPIRGETDNTLFIPVAKSEHVGLYSVRVLNRFDRFVFSPAVRLQIGSLGGFLWQDKSEAVLYSLGLGAFVPIGAGVSFFQEGPAAASRQAGDPNPCGNPFFGTLWQGLAATNNGIIEVNTIGSEIPARMAVYQITGGADDFFKPAFICDLSSASNGVPAVAKFPATKGTNYAIVLEGFEASGNLLLNCKMGVAPPLTNALKYCFVPESGGITLAMPATDWCPLPDCQWRFNGVDIPGAPGSSLTLSGFSALQVGTYSVRMSNFVRTATREVANVALVGPFTVNHWWTTNAGKVGFVLNASNAVPFVLETSTNLNGLWSPIATNPDPCSILIYTNSSALTTPQRFFRAAPWPPVGP